MRIDVRAVANFVLNAAKQADVPVTNMAINKIVYFMYVDYLVSFGERLTNAKIEAWKHGPVFRELYSAFNRFGDSPISELATRIDPNTGDKIVCELSLDPDKTEFLQTIVEQLLKLSASRLRNLSHLPGSPWDKVWNHLQLVNVGMEISDEIILSSNSNGWRH
jgi:uncharacterized phage-associated protein